MRKLLLLIAGMASALTQTVSADVLSGVNWARQRGCNASGTFLPLRFNVKLAKAAARLAGGAGLRDALASEGYTASEFAALHFTGAFSDAQFERRLAASYCRTLTNPKLREIGAERRGAELWIVLAVPVAIPAAADAAVVIRQILAAVNAARASGRRCGSQYFAPVAPLALNARLTSAALAHSREMASHGEFDHRGHDGSTPARRVERAGYGEHRIVGENIAAGPMTALEVTEGWLASPAHCENIMDGRFTQVGIAYAASSDTAVGMYWTQDFAAPR